MPLHRLGRALARMEGVIMKTKVVWTTREWELIARWFIEQNLDPKHRGFSTRLGAAQDARLPADRRRGLVGLDSRVRQTLSEAMNRVQKRLESKPVSEKSAKANLESIGLEALLVEVARRVARLLTPPAVIDTAIPTIDNGPAKKHNPFGVQEERKRRNGFCIVGPDSALQARLNNDFNDVPLKFSAFGENPARIADVCGNSVAVLGLTRFMSHAQQQAARATGLPVHLFSTILELRNYIKEHA